MNHRFPDLLDLLQLLSTCIYLQKVAVPFYLTVIHLFSRFARSEGCCVTSYSSTVSSVSVSFLSCLFATCLEISIHGKQNLRRENARAHMHKHTQSTHKQANVYTQNGHAHTNIPLSDTQTCTHASTKSSTHARTYSHCVRFEPSTYFTGSCISLSGTRDTAILRCM